MFQPSDNQRTYNNNHIFKVICLSISIFLLLILFALEGAETFILFIGSILLVFLGLIGILSFSLIPMEYMISIVVIPGLLASSQFWIDLPDSPITFYIRYAPAAIIVFRTFLYIGAFKVRVLMVTKMVLFPFGLLGLLALLSSIYSASPNETFQRSISLLLVVIVLGVSLPLYLRSEPQRVRRMLFLSAFFSFAFVMLGGVLFLLGNENTVIYNRGLPRFVGISSGPTALGPISMLIFFTFLALIPTNRGLPRYIMILFMFILILSMSASGSRASFVGFGAGMFAVFFLSLYNRSLRTKAIILGVIGVAVTILALQVADSSLEREGDNGRFEIWENYIEFGLKTPLFGTGFSPTADVFAATLIQTGRYRQYSQHNDYIRMFNGLGLAGLAIMIFGIINIIIRGIRYIQRGDRDLFVVALIGGVVAAAVHVNFEVWMFNFGTGGTFLFWLQLAIVAMSVEYPLSNNPL